MSMIQVSHLTFGYEGSFDNIFEDVSFQIDTDWKLGFIGRNGRGKTTFLNLLLGRYEYTGTITHSVEFEYFPHPVEDREEMTLTILEGIAPEAQLWEIQRELSLLEVEEGVLYRPFSTLSNGEQTKTLLAALFLKENRFLLIDEPTNHLDTLAREKVGEYLAGKKGFILVSHDRAFLDRCVDHVLSINRADIEVQRGNYSSWQQNKDRRMVGRGGENQKGNPQRRAAARPGIHRPQGRQNDEAGQIHRSPAGGCRPGEGRASPQPGTGWPPQAPLYSLL